MPYKVVRCKTAGELARDAGGKQAGASNEVRGAERACREIAEGLVGDTKEQASLPAVWVPSARPPLPLPPAAVVAAACTDELDAQ